ncbi:hypothetical protein AA14337_2905 [Acetobacter malorum DSM 14337]|uniref:Uncharacterized protein n=1 Tax=Acetobacter malorum DSM 14337 TaxID=1307910 RepID=A0ABQ0PYG9_9PROT|nr:hypothetical protein [Acetobacter malorum]KXV06789.1 hypothetical protein AD930_06740 [Acetobacter malorum]GBQ84755.1 hypothetical protein AA14337_2905 [Acetobacter malorum DSM 14337]
MSVTREQDKAQYWIVNEDGQNVRISEGKGSDGCFYRREGHDTVLRLVQHDGETLVDGEFAYHAQAFIRPEENPCGAMERAGSSPPSADEDGPSP